MFNDAKKAVLHRESETVDLEKAVFNPKLSSIEFDSEKSEFWASTDKVQFETPYEIISKVLTANGYAINIENMLAAIDSFKVCVKALGPQPIDEEPMQAKQYTTGVSFKMPQKNAKGKLLQEFYTEIQAYEAELGRLQQFENEGDEKENKNEAQLIKENRQLRQMNDRLASKVDEMTQALIILKRQQAASNQAFAEAEKLPVELRTGKVKSVSLMDRVINVKTEKQSFTVSMLQTDRIPKENDPALLYIIDGAVHGAYFYASSSTALTKEAGTVLHIESQSVKILRANRAETVLKAKSDFESKILKKLAAKDKVLLHILDGQIVKYESLDHSDKATFEDVVNEEIVKSQISGISYEKYIADAPSATEEEEAA